MNLLTQKWTNASGQPFKLIKPAQAVIAVTRDQLACQPVDNPASLRRNEEQQI